MAKRLVDTKIRSSYSFSKLTFRQRDLWHGLIESVDDQGRMPGEPAYVRSMIWAYDDVPLIEVEEDLQVLVKEQMIHIYEKNGSRFLQIINWWKYQSSNWMGASNYPAPDGWLDRYRYHTKGNKIVLKNWGIEGGFVNQDSNQDTNQDTSLHCSEDDDDVNDDVNGDVNDDDDDEVKASVASSNDNNPSLREQLLTTFSKETAIPMKNKKLRKEDEDALQRMVDVEVSVVDLCGGIQYMKNKGFPIVGLKSVVGPTLIEHQKRNRSSPSQNGYKDGQYGKYIRN
jgi:hypothetical protein